MSDENKKGVEEMNTSELVKQLIKDLFTVLDGIRYELRYLNYFDYLKIKEKEVDLKIVNGAIKPEIKSAGTTLSFVAAAIDKWEFKGVDERGRLKTEGNILPITNDNVKLLPPRHGQILHQAIRRLNDVVGEEEKKLLGMSLDV